MVNKNMKQNHKKILPIVLTLSITMLAISMLSPAQIVSVKVTATDTTVTRLLSTTNPTSGSMFDVTLNITGLEIGSFVETIPDGFAFVRTTHPSNQTYISGQKVVFVIVNETLIKYEAQALSEGSGTFSGMWYDALNEKEGDIERTDVSVKVAETPTPSPVVTPTPSSPPIPGFEAVFTLAGLITFAFLLLFMRKGKGKRGGEK
jgi:hypothetical protein